MTERHVPYLATTSLRKLVGSLGKDQEITKLKARGSTGKADKDHEYHRIGMTIRERATMEACVDYLGRGMDKDRLITRLDQLEIHDMSVDEIRLKTPGGMGFIKAIKRPWPRRKDGLETDVLERFTIPKDAKAYVNLKNNGVNFDPNDYNVDSGRTFAEFWDRMNRCEVCGAPLQAHKFKRRILEVPRLGISSEWIVSSIPKKKRPEISAYTSPTAKWVFHNVAKPTGLVSPNGMKHYRLGKEEQWILEGV